ncbi:MAG TPA: peptidoglycan DD-metalloendopeptidase family protein, partial [Candidatus Negativibacillus faecipullorum]|nr:peptidoglycan DD-metalloendopeptidase family protein [Candidatus Negativibacillus faecipullorum]
RFDCVSKLLLSAALCLHWFNPLVWVMYVLANRDLELSCDEMVLRLLGIENRSAYAMALLEMEEKRSGFGALYSAFGKNAIEERIGAIMKMKKRSLLSAVMAVVLVFTLTACLATSPVEEETGAPAAEEKNTIESETMSAISDLTEEEKNHIGWEYNRKWLLWDYTAYGFTYNEETEKWQYQGLDVHAFLDPEKDIHLINDEPGLSFLATYDENGKLNIQRIDRETAGKLYIEYFGSPILYDNRIDLYKDNPDTIFVGQWSEYDKRSGADGYLEFGLSLDMESNLVYNGELVRYLVDGVTHELNDGDFTLDSDLATRQSEECVYLYEYYNPEGTVDLYTVHSREREDFLGGLYSIEEFEPSVLEGKQFQLVDIKEREQRKQEEEVLSWDEKLEKLDALKEYGVTYEKIDEGIQMHYQGYLVSRLVYAGADVPHSFTLTSVGVPMERRASMSVYVDVSSGGEVEISNDWPLVGSIVLFRNYGIAYDEEQKAWAYNGQIIKYFIDGVDGQFPFLLRDDGEINLKVNYDENHYISGLEKISDEQAQALWEQAEAADSQTGQTEPTVQPTQTQQLATDTTTAAAPIAPVKETTMVEDVNHYGDTNSRRYWAQEGTPVTCSVAGEVVASGWESGYGNRVQVQDASGITWTYAHLKEISAQQGDQLQAGEQLGTVGHTGNAGSPTTYCLGLYAEKDGQELNVAQLFARGEEISL